MLYLMHEASQLMLAPARITAEAMKMACENPFHPLAYAPNSNVIAAGCEMFERTTRTYRKPSFDVADSERVIWEKPFCRVIAFDDPSDKPKVLLVAPMSGHYATLLRGTVAAFLGTHQVFITDWTNAREVPVSAGGFDLDDYIDYCIEMFQALGPDLHVTAVCQPSVPVLSAIARMEEEDLPGLPLSATLIGGPIDTRRSPTAVNTVAQEKGIRWFEQNCIQTVPGNHPGSGRAVYPGFVQLVGFMSMNPERHAGSHWDMFDHLVEGDGESAEKHRRFYDEYLAAMDLTAEFYLQTVDQVFIRHLLPEGQLTHRGKPVRLEAIRRCALMAVEGEKDDITGVGQTKAALDLTPNLAEERKQYHLQPGAGHYGIFNGSRFREDIVPKIVSFMAASARTPQEKTIVVREGRLEHARGGHANGRHWHGGLAARGGRRGEWIAVAADKRSTGAVEAQRLPAG